ncbi:MAG: pyridoxamine 5'-phosphate oxidase family protein, partial [Bacteroidota bacterium]
MKKYVSDIAFTPAVKAFQEKEGSRIAYQRMAEQKDWNTDVDPILQEFIGKQDSFYLATANAQGQPCIQHRGGAIGFLKVVDQHTLGFADFAGNR